ncbi:unnamed protein product, partial [Mesorhabditis spiculigera]
MVLDDDPDIDDAWRHTANMLQARQQITNNAITKRREQLTRWGTSEMNGASTSRRSARVQFHDEDVFLSACMSGDEDEVDELLGKGANINTATIDGLTALHQSVIDSKPEMVRFLCDKGADVNAQDNEGWTPLHAAACCGKVEIVEYLCKRGADLTIINSDKELALDLAEDEACREFLDNEYRLKGVDPGKCRERELTTMMSDVEGWLRSGHIDEKPHPRTGATALHVAAAKGYTQVIHLLLQAGANIHALDKDGWTPLHAAAHWGERESCKVLIENGASLTEPPSTPQAPSVLAVADKELVEYLEELDKTVIKKKPSVAPARPLREKNSEASPVDTTQHTHPRHFHSADQKHALVIKDEREENATLHSEPKQPRLTGKDASDEGSAESDRSTATVSSVEEKPLRNGTTPPVRSFRDSGSSAREISAEFKATASVFSEEKEPAAPSISATVPLRPAATSWINRNLPLSSSRPLPGQTEIMRSASTTSALPWVRSGVGIGGPGPAPNSLNTSASTSAFSTFLQKDRVSAFRPLTKLPQDQESANSAPNLLPAQSSPRFPPVRNHSLAAPALRPWQAPAPTQESEAERRKEARMQRQYRRSTQGVTKEQLEEASKVAQEEQEKRRREEELAQTTSATPPTSAVSARRRSGQFPGQHTANRAVRRGTGPVVSEDVHAAVSLRCVAPAQAQPGGATQLPTAAYTPMSGVSFQSGASSGFPLIRTQLSQTNSKEKSHSQPPVSSVPEATVMTTTSTPSATTTSASVGFKGTANGTNPPATFTTSNYRQLYEQQKMENDRLRKELEEYRRSVLNGASNRRPTTTPTSQGSTARSSSGLDTDERRNMEKRINDLEYELKNFGQLRVENQRLKEENGALVRVISKMTI